MADPRTSIAVPPKLKAVCEKRAAAKYPPIGWTQELVLLAQQGLASEQMRSQVKAPRTPQHSDI